MHQKSKQRELPLGEWGEAPDKQRWGEAGRAAHGTERSGNHGLLMERAVARENAREAFKRVRRNKGSPGIDGMTGEELERHLRAHWPVIREQLLAGTYRLCAVKQQLIPKSGGGMRQLGRRWRSELRRHGAVWEIRTRERLCPRRACRRPCSVMHGYRISARCVDDRELRPGGTIARD